MIRYFFSDIYNLRYVHLLSSWMAQHAVSTCFTQFVSPLLPCTITNIWNRFMPPGIWSDIYGERREWERERARERFSLFTSLALVLSIWQYSQRGISVYLLYLVHLVTCKVLCPSVMHELATFWVWPEMPLKCSPNAHEGACVSDLLAAFILNTSSDGLFPVMTSGYCQGYATRLCNVLNLLHNIFVILKSPLWLCKMHFC